MIVLAHNEATLISATITSVLRQQWDHPTQLKRILVVSTASTDGTDAIVAARAAQNTIIQLEVIAKRRGKVADVNTAINLSRAALLVIMDADVTLSEHCIPLLLRPFCDHAVGMTTPQRAVQNPRTGLANRIGHLAAEMHNAIPGAKAGQIIAIDRACAPVDARVPVDDAFQEWTVKRAGRQLLRIDDAVVYSTAPATISEFIGQRRRVHAQYLTLAAVTGYRPATRSARTLITALLRTRTLRNDVRIDVIVAAAALDIGARILGRIDHTLLCRDYITWTAAESTKNHG